MLNHVKIYLCFFHTRETNRFIIIHIKIKIHICICSKRKTIISWKCIANNSKWNFIEHKQKTKESLTNSPTNSLNKLERKRKLTNSWNASMLRNRMKNYSLINNNVDDGKRVKWPKYSCSLNFFCIFWRAKLKQKIFAPTLKKPKKTLVG